MAKINGFKVKKVKEFNQKGETYFCGNLCLEGKKIGEWSTNIHGMNNFVLKKNFSEEKIQKLLEEEYPQTKFPNGYSLNDLILDLLELKKLQKLYKRELKKTKYPVLVILSKNKEVPYHFQHISSCFYHCYSDEMTKQNDEAFKNQLFRVLNQPDDDWTGHKLIGEVFRSLDDFSIGRKFFLDEIRI